MAFHGLVEGDCGNPSSLIKLTSHYVQDHGFKEEGIYRPFGPQEEFQTPDADQLVQQFLQEPICPQTFRMDNLLQEMREIDQTIHPPIIAPGIANELADLDIAWNNVCLKPTESFQVNLCIFIHCCIIGYLIDYLMIL
jgi:peroxin-5